MTQGHGPGPEISAMVTNKIGESFDVWTRRLPAAQTGWLLKRCLVHFYVQRCGSIRAIDAFKVQGGGGQECKARHTCSLPATRVNDHTTRKASWRVLELKVNRRGAKRPSGLIG